MAEIILKPKYYIFCAEPVSVFPVGAGKGCFVNLQGHLTEPDGIYIYTGTTWVAWRTL